MLSVYPLSLIIPAVVIVALVVIGLIVARLYVRSTKELAFVRTGFGGQKVILNGGALVLPVFHEITKVNMKTLRLEVKRSQAQALITGDRMRVDVQAEFYVRVKPDANSIAQAAQTLGDRTMMSEELKELIEGKFVDALRSVAAEMSMTQLHEKRSEFVQKVQQVVAEDLSKNGLELETVSLTGLDQTSKEHFNPNNAFDAEGLLKLTQEIEDRRKKRNDIEQETRVQIEEKNLEAKRKSLDIQREEEYAQLEQEREISIRKAELSAEIASKEASKAKDAQNARIVADQEVERSRITNERQTEEERIKKQQVIEQAEIEKQKAIKLSEQQKEVAIFEKSKEESLAKAEADKARAESVKEAENVITVRETAQAEREKSVELVEAAKEAERQALSIKIGADAEKAAANDLADAKRIEAEGSAEAIKIVADADAKRLAVEAEGREKINNASNILSNEQIELKIKLALIEVLPSIIEQSVKPIENIESIKILEANGLGGVTGGASVNTSEGNSLSDQIVSSALKYKAQAPLVDSMLSDLGLKLGDISGFSESVGLSSQSKKAAPVNQNSTSNSGLTTGVTTDTTSNKDS